MKKSFKKTIAIFVAALMVVCSFPLTSFAAESNRQWWVDDSVDPTTITQEPAYQGYNYDWPESAPGEDDGGPWEYALGQAVNGVEDDDLRDYYKPVLGVITQAYGSADWDNKTNYLKNAAAYDNVHGTVEYSALASAEAGQGNVINPAQLHAGDRIAVSIELGGVDVVNTGGIRFTFDTSKLKPGHYTAKPTSKSSSKWASSTDPDSTYIIRDAGTLFSNAISASALMGNGYFAVGFTGKAYSGGSTNISNFIGSGCADRAALGAPFAGHYGLLFLTVGFEVQQDCDLTDAITLDTAATYLEPYSRDVIAANDGVSNPNNSLYKIGCVSGSDTFALFAPLIYDSYSAGSAPVTTHTVTYTRGGVTVDTLTVNDGTLIADLTGVPANTAQTQTAQYITTYSWDYGTATAVTADMTVPEVSTQATRTYDVTFTNYAGVDTVVHDVAYGSTPTAPANTAADAQYTYAWPTIAAVDGTAATLAYTETRATRTYDVTFTNYAGVDTVVEDVAYGSIPTAPANTAADAQYTYAWPTLVAVDGTAATLAYTETRATNSYTITFVDKDNNSSEVNAAYGTTIASIAPANSPSVTNQAGTIVYKWDYESGATVTGDATINEIVDQAASQVADYTVTYTRGGATVGTVTVPYGTLIADLTGVPALTPNVDDAQHTVVYSWDYGTATAVEDNMTVPETSVETIKSYDIVFVNYAGETVQSQNLQYGATVTAPANTANDAYYTYAWPTVEATVTGAATYNETRATNTYNVTFTNAANVKVADLTVDAGTDITAQIPANTAPASISDTQHNTYSWGDVATTVLADAAYTETATAADHSFDSSAITTPATYEAPGVRTYTCSVCGATKDEAIPQLTGGVTLEFTATTMGTIKLGKIDVTDGYTTSVARDSRAYFSATANDGANFLGWAINGKIVSPNAIWDMEVNANTVITPVFTETKADGSFTVVFVDNFGNVLKTQTVTSGAEIEAPEDPARMGYRFTGWDPADLTSITAGTTIKPQYVTDIATYNYTVSADGCDITYEGKTLNGTFDNIPFNGEVTVTAAGATEWYANGSTDPVGYGASYTFYVGSDITLTYGSASVAATPTITALGVARVGDTAYINFYATRTIPDGYKLVKAGYVYGKGVDASELTLENVGNGHVYAGYCSTDTEQFLLKTGSASKTGTMRACAFIIYTDGTTQTTAYAAAQEYTY